MSSYRVSMQNIYIMRLWKGNNNNQYLSWIVVSARPQVSLAFLENMTEKQLKKNKSSQKSRFQGVFIVQVPVIYCGQWLKKISPEITNFN